MNRVIANVDLMKVYVFQNKNGIMVNVEDSVKN